MAGKWSCQRLVKRTSSFRNTYMSAGYRKDRLSRSQPCLPHTSLGRSAHVVGCRLEDSRFIAHFADFGCGIDVRDTAILMASRLRESACEK